VLEKEVARSREVKEYVKEEENMTCGAKIMLETYVEI
jgi:hypothetical protein